MKSIISLQSAVWGLDANKSDKSYQSKFIFIAIDGTDPLLSWNAHNLNLGQGHFSKWM